MSVVLTEVSDRILTVTLNRPEKLNALNAEVVEELRRVFHDAKGSPEVGAVILTGAGESFSSGMDLKEYFKEVDKATPVEVMRAAALSPLQLAQ